MEEIAKIAAEEKITQHIEEKEGDRVLISSLNTNATDITEKKTKLREQVTHYIRYKCKEEM